MTSNHTNSSITLKQTQRSSLHDTLKILKFLKMEQFILGNDRKDKNTVKEFKFGPMALYILGTELMDSLMDMED